MEGLRGRWEEERGTWERGSRDGRKDDKAARGLHVQRWQRRVWIPITYLVILNILRSRRARRTLIPKDVPGLKMAQTTSKILPTVT